MMDRLLGQLSSDARALLVKERTLPADDEAMRRRILERARAALDADRPSGVSLRLADQREASHVRARRTLLLIAAAVAVAGLAAAGAGMLERGPAAAPSVRLAPPSTPARRGELTPARPAAASVETQPSTAPARPEPRAAAVAPAESSRLASAPTYALELALLEPARSSIARGDFSAALSAIARHQREYAHGQLAEEREALRVRALWGMGQTVAAESAATAFRKRYPRSGLLSWMKGAVTAQ